MVQLGHELSSPDILPELAVKRGVDSRFQLMGHLKRAALNEVTVTHSSSSLRSDAKRMSDTGLTAWRMGKLSQDDWAIR